MGTIPARIRFVAHDFFQFAFARISPNQTTLQYFVSVPHGLQDASAQERAALTARAVRAVWRSGIGHPDCLNASLTLWWLLARQGIASDLRVGVHKDGGKFEAHAWVECGGAALNEPEPRHQHFRAFDAALALLPPEPQ